jgi:peptide-methionine (R)-S-oxide reductase
VYACGVCGSELFAAETAFDFGTGCWPNFGEALEGGDVVAIGERVGGTHAGREAHCKACGSYLGQVFSDGPGRTAERYCIEWRAIRLIEAPRARESRRMRQM